MVPHVLGVGYAYNEYEVLLADGKNLKLNLTMLIILNKRPQCCLLKNNICVAICSDVIPQDDLDI